MVRPKAKPPVHQHGAVIAINGKIISKGTNHNRSVHRGRFSSSTHAECDAIFKFLKLNKSKSLRSLRKTAQRSTLYVVRKCRKTGGFAKSTPCIHCAKTMKKYGFKRIIYSDNSESQGYKVVNINKTEVKDITTHLSKAQKDAVVYIPPHRRM